MRDFPEQLRQRLLASNPVAGQLLSAHQLNQLVEYYTLVLKWNPRLHLTTLTSPEEFYGRHLSEALWLEQFFVANATSIYDIGSGAGIPGLPLAILRPARTTFLVEVNQKKATFLAHTIATLNLPQVGVLEKRFETLPPAPPNSAVVVRALERLESFLPQLLVFATQATQLLILGGPLLVERAQQMVQESFQLCVQPLPNTQQSYLLKFERST